VTIYSINPLTDHRWDILASQHPRATVFHQRNWLEALARTYKYEPLVLTSTPPGQPLSDGMPLCRVSSWITGTRLVSMPFADHCEPLLESPSDFQKFAGWLHDECDRHHWKYVEIRPLSSPDQLQSGLPKGGDYAFHSLDIRAELAQIFSRFHKTSVQQMIRKAEKAGLVCESGRSPEMVEAFYGLLLKTRRRHQIFPQPRQWFKNLFDCLGENAEVRVARKDGVPIAAILVLRHQASLVYKYGCSDERFHNLGGIQLLLWKLIEQSKPSGAAELDFGRSDLDNDGLIKFKDRFGATRQSLTYLRYPKKNKSAAAAGWGERAARQLFSIMPDTISPVAGSILYRHIG